MTFGLHSAVLKKLTTEIHREDAKITEANPCEKEIKKAP